jgi:hypothetical protein
LDENHPHKKITKKKRKTKETRENPFVEVAFDSSQSLCICFGGLKGVFIEFRNNPSRFHAAYKSKIELE